ncbi:MAG: hypothetical protein EOP04_03945 [Proteobacteria bacterium]|nr:MAG: hypothetical protein EOP04_03945 [Pseudomonadota bacterium]
MVNTNIYQNTAEHSASRRYKIVFEEVVKSGKPHVKDFLGDWLATVENAPEIGARVETDSLEQADLFWVNDYCRHIVCFDQRPFAFARVD